jgi:hypothetical protein
VKTGFITNIAWDSISSSSSVQFRNSGQTVGLRCLIHVCILICGILCNLFLIGTKYKVSVLKPSYFLIHLRARDSETRGELRNSAVMVF